MQRRAARALARALGVERRALAHAEAVLLVDDADGEPRELDVGLDQGVGADDQRRARPVASRSSVSRRRAGGRRAGQQRERDRPRRRAALEGRGVLLGERLGRRHQRGLVARLERAQHRVEGDHGLARADLAHQQPLHRLARREVGVDLVERVALVRR